MLNVLNIENSSETQNSEHHKFLYEEARGEKKKSLKKYHSPFKNK